MASTIESKYEDSYGGWFLEWIKREKYLRIET
jgi:hypothetical protein